MIWGFLIGNFNIKYPFSSGCQFFTYLQFDIPYVSIRFKIGNGAFYFIFYFDIPCLNSFLNMTFGLLVYFSNLIYNNWTPQSGSNNKPPRHRQRYHDAPTAILLPTQVANSAIPYPVTANYNTIPPPKIALPCRHIKIKRYTTNDTVATPPPPTIMLSCHHLQHYPTVAANDNAILSTPPTPSHRRRQYYPTNDTDATPPPPTTLSRRQQKRCLVAAMRGSRVVYRACARKHL